MALGAGDESPAVGVACAALMRALAAGLWARVYLVILLFQALLAITIIVSTLSLAFAGNLAGVVLVARADPRLLTDLLAARSE